MAKATSTISNEPTQTEEGEVVMTCTLIIRGAEIELHDSEKFNKVRDRLNRARKLAEDYKNGAVAGEKDFKPFHLLTFRTADDGRFSGDIENVFGVLSDEPKDIGSGKNNDEEYDEDDDE